MKYLKPALSFQEQADLLISRGLLADRDELISYLKQVNYYRVTGYLYPFKQSDDSEEFIAGTTLEMIQEYRNASAGSCANRDDDEMIHKSIGNIFFMVA